MAEKIFRKSLTRSSSQASRGEEYPDKQSKVSCLIIQANFKTSLNSHADGMAVAWPYSFEIDFVRNPISRSAAGFFVIILKLIFIPIFEIKFMKKIPWKKNFSRRKYLTPPAWEFIWDLLIIIFIEIIPEIHHRRGLKHFQNLQKILPPNHRPIQNREHPFHDDSFEKMSKIEYLHVREFFYFFDNSVRITFSFTLVTFSKIIFWSDCEILSPLIISTFPKISTLFLPWRKCAYYEWAQNKKSFHLNYSEFQLLYMDNTGIGIFHIWGGACGVFLFPLFDQRIWDGLGPLSHDWTKCKIYMGISGSGQAFSD